MKSKLTLLLLSLLCSVGTWADVNIKVHASDKQVQKSANDSYYGYYSGKTYTTTGASGLSGLTMVWGSQSWDRAGNSIYYLVSPKFTASTSDSFTITAPTGYVITGYSMEACGWSSSHQFIATAADGTTSISINGTTTKTLTVSGLNTNSTTITVSATTEGNFSIKNMTVTMQTYTVTYTVVDGSATVSGGSADKMTGIVSAPNIADTKGANGNSSYNNPYCTYSYYSDAACTTPISSITAACTVYAKVTSTSSVPVEFASAVDDGDAKWYTLKLRTKSFYVSGESVAVSGSDIVSADAQWVFTGSVCNAFVYNKDAGKYLVMSAGTAALSDTPQPWILAPHQSGSGFYLYYASDYKFMYVNSSDALAYSSGPFYETANAASFVATEVPADYSANIVTNVQPFFTTGVGDYFGLKSSVYDTYNARVTAAASLCDDEEYAALLAVVENAANFVYPSTGYYRFQNYAGGYFGKTTSSDVVGGLSGTDAASVIKLTRSGEEGSYVYTIQVQGSSYVESTGNFTFSVAAPGYFYFNDRTTNTRFGYVQASGSTISADAKSTAAQWILEDASTATVALNAVGDKTYGTTYLPFDVTLPAGDVCAYTLTDNGNGWLHLDLLGTDGKSIPAGTPVLLRGTSTTSVTAIIANVADINTDGNALSGTYLSMEPGNNLVLGKIDDAVGFYKYSFNIKPNKAYISVGQAVKEMRIMLDDDDDATAINSLTPALSEGEGAIYNIAGQRMSRMQKGVNIVNGKKVLY
ncbi:MAG: hypothetical protein K6F47_02185 [Bacteroidaceae bacterium]|nr:hypothetical protein [Bacteroidaceae bacterium]